MFIVLYICTFRLWQCLKCCVIEVSSAAIFFSLVSFAWTGSGREHRLVIEDGHDVLMLNYSPWFSSSESSYYRGLLQPDFILSAIFNGFEVLEPHAVRITICNGSCKYATVMAFAIDDDSRYYHLVCRYLDYGLLSILFLSFIDLSIFIFFEESIFIFFRSIDFYFSFDVSIGKIL